MTTTSLMPNLPRMELVSEPIDMCLALQPSCTFAATRRDAEAQRSQPAGFAATGKGGEYRDQGCATGGGRARNGAASAYGWAVCWAVWGSS